MQNIRNTFFKYVSANILGMIGLSCYILADTFFIAQGVGANGLTALNLAIPVYNFMHGLGLMIGMGGATRYSISKGNADSAMRDYIFTHSLYLTLLFSSIFFVLGLTCAEPLSILLGANAETLRLTTEYLKILMIFTPFFMCNNLLICFVRNDGAPQLSMLAMLTGSFSNIFMDYLFIFPLHLGMKGAALATAASPVISIFILSIHFGKKNNQFHLRCVHPSFKRSLDICALGSSSLIVEVSSGVVMLIFNLLILTISGNIGVAAYGVIANIALVLTAMYTGISQGIQPVISQCFGKKEYHQIRQILFYAFATSAVLAVVSYLITFIWSQPIVSAFNKDGNETLNIIATHGMHIYFIAFLFVGMNITTATFLSSTDHPKEAFLLSIFRGFVLVIPLAFLLSALFGINGIWLTLPVTELLVSFPAIFFIRKTFYKLLSVTKKENKMIE